MQLAGVRPTVVWIFFGWTLRTTMLRIKYESVRVLGFSALNLTKPYREDEFPIDITDMRKLLIKRHNRQLKTFLLVLATKSHAQSCPYEKASHKCHNRQLKTFLLVLATKSHAQS